MKSKKYTFNFIIIIAIIIVSHIALLFTGVFQVPLKSILYADSFLLTLYVLGTLIIAPGLDKAPDNFVNRFLILTTVQLMSAMFAILTLVVAKVSHVKVVGYNLFAVFICLMIAQSVFLFLSIRKKLD